MPKLTLKDVDVKGKRVLVRVDFNVPMNGVEVCDDTRIRETLPTLKYLLAQNAKIILLSHLGRPKGKIVESLRLDPVQKHLAKLLGVEIKKTEDCVGAEVKTAVENLKEGEILLLENVRFHPEETANDPAFAAELAGFGEVFVEEAFGVIHRDHASVTGIAKHLPTVAGLLVYKEIKELSRIFDNPPRPLVLIIGGAKIDTKIGILKQFLPLADTILLGGGLANTFLAAKGYEIGASLFEPEKLDLAREILAEAETRGEKLLLPSDVVCADATEKISDTTPTVDLEIANVPNNVKIYDIGKTSRKTYAELIANAGTVVWNGPVGLFELKPFESGTRAIAEACAKTKAVTLLGGGDTLDALRKFGIAPDEFTHVSTGGGAMLELLEGKVLPGLEVIQKRAGE